MKTGNDRSAYVVDDFIELEFPFDLEIIQQVREIPGRAWNTKAHPGVWSVPFTPWHAAQVLKVTKMFDFTVEDEIKKIANSKAKPPKLELPNELYGYQKTGVGFEFSSGGRCINADDCGTGKSAEALVYVEMFGGKTLIVSPSNVTWKWALNEVPMWTKGKTVQVIETGKQEILSTDITIMSYAMMVSHFDELMQLPFITVVFDEAHYLKSHKTQRTRAAKALVKNIPHILFLSGTPFMNRPMELFPLLNMLDPLSWNNPFQFAIRYCGAELIEGHLVIPPNGVSHADELAERLKYIMIRRTKREVAKELPDMTRTSIPIKIENMTEYKKAAHDIRKWWQENKTDGTPVRTPGRETSYVPQLDRKTSINALAKLNYLRQIVGRGKVSAAIELAESILQNDERVVLFAHHKEVVQRLADGLKEYKVGIISGDTKPRDRQTLVEDFLDSHHGLMQGSGIRVMIITVAGAEGIDLYSASNIIFVEREWTPAREEQAEARLHRIGQKNPVTAHYIVATNTVDEKLDALVREKREIIGSVIHQDLILETVLEALE